MKTLRRIYYIIFPTYKRLELKRLSYRDADILLRANEFMSEENKWHIAKEEDTNEIIGIVYLERKVRITE